MISINATLVLQVIHFLILAFILNRLMIQPLLRLINERTQHIAKTKAETNNIEDETARLKEEYLARENDARIKATQERARLRGMGISETEETLNNARKEMVSLRGEADREAENEIKKTQPVLHEQATSLAEQIMEKVIGRRIEA